MDSSFDDIHAGSYSRLRGTAARLVSWQDADDLVQGAFVRALQAKGGFRAEAARTSCAPRHPALPARRTPGPGGCPWRCDAR